jgi:hypothetical protein
MNLRLVLYLIVIGVALQITAYRTKNIKLFKVGFAVFSGPCLGAGIILLQNLNFWVNVIGFVFLCLVWINWLIIKKLDNNNFQLRSKSKFAAFVRVVGRKKELMDYFKYNGIEMPKLRSEGNGRYSAEHKVHLNRLPVVDILKGFVLDITPESSPGKWQLKFGTNFGEMESYVYDVIDIFIKYEKDDDIYHHFEFEQGKVWIHLIDFSPIFWRPAG